MSKIIKISPLSLLFSFVTGCSIVEIINDNYNPYEYEPNIAVVIIGGYGDTTVGEIKAETKDGIKRFANPSGISEQIDAFAWKIKVGETFKIERANMERDLKFVKFPGSHTLNIEKQGIYYYGSIISSNKKAVISDKVFPEVINVAKLKYRKIFNKLKPMNFK
jgi:hypothetical protein